MDLIHVCLFIFMLPVAADAVVHPNPDQGK